MFAFENNNYILSILNNDYHLKRYKYHLSIFRNESTAEKK